MKHISRVYSKSRHWRFTKLLECVSDTQEFALGESKEKDIVSSGSHRKKSSIPFFHIRNLPNMPKQWSSLFTTWKERNTVLLKNWALCKPKEIIHGYRGYFDGINKTNLIISMISISIWWSTGQRRCKTICIWLLLMLEGGVVVVEEKGEVELISCPSIGN